MLQDLIGYTKNTKIIDESYKIYLEEFEKKFPEYFSKYNSKAFALVTTTNKKEILDIGMSCIDDILNDNWGIFLKNFLSGNSGNDTYKNTSGLSKLMLLWGTQNMLYNITNAGFSVGTRIATGSGVTLATRQDFDIESEKNKEDTGNGGWNSGLGKIDIPMTATGVSAYSLTETCLFGTWNAVGAENQFCLARDNITPVSVLIGQTINVDYQMLLS